jgi:hypothetical protein
LGGMKVNRKRFLKIGTRSVLFGAHQFLLHPLFLALAWTKLYGFPFDPRLWAAFFLHDVGYIGLENMDGTEGEVHPALGGKIMATLFGQEWGDFTKYHSRSFANLDQKQPSRLCAADKLATVLVPKKLYLTLIHLSGEVEEYLESFRGSLASRGKYAMEAKYSMEAQIVPSEEYGSVEHWYASAMLGNRQWIVEHSDYTGLQFGDAERWESVTDGK